MAKRKSRFFKEQFSLTMNYTPKTDFCPVLVQDEYIGDKWLAFMGV